MLRLRAETQRDEIAYRFLADGEEERSTLTYGELYSRARRVAAELQKQTAAGQRALLLNSSEADYIVAFFRLSLRGSNRGSDLCASFE